MRHRLVVAALALSALIVAPACAQPIQYQAADGMNNTPVSAANPLPVTGTISATSAATAQAALPTLSAGVNNLYENLSGELFVHDTSLLAAVNGAIPAGSNIIGKVGIDQTTPGTTNGVQTLSGSVTTATLAPSATAGWTPTFQAALSSTVTAIKASAGSLAMAYCYNANASPIYIQIFNLPFGSVTVGTTAPIHSYPIAATQTGGLAMSAIPILLGGSGISWAATTTATGSTAPGTAAVCNGAYS